MSSQPTADLLRRWAPVVKLDSKEQYFPSSADWYLRLVDLVGPNGVLKAQPAGADPNAMMDLYPGEKRDWNLVIHDSGGNSVATTRAGVRPDSAGAASDLAAYGYARPVPGTSDFYDLLYCFFYPFNGPVLDRFMIDSLDASQVIVADGAMIILEKIGQLVLGGGFTIESLADQVRACTPGVGSHEGDWEGVIVRVQGDDPQKSALQAVYFSQHDGGQWVDAADLETGTGGRPVVYSARNSHAGYPHAGSDLNRIRGLCPEYYDGGYPAAWDTATTLEVLSWDPDALVAVSWRPFQLVPGAQPPASAPAAACNQQGQLVEVEYSASHLLCRAGFTMSDGTLSLTAPPQQFETGTLPSVAINDNAVVASAHVGSKGGLWLTVGTFNDPSSSTADIVWTPVSSGQLSQQVATVPGFGGLGISDTAVAIDSNNTVIAAAAGFVGITIAVVPITAEALAPPARDPIGHPVTSQIAAAEVSGVSLTVNSHGRVLMIASVKGQLTSWLGQLTDGTLAWLSANQPVTLPNATKVKGAWPSAVLTDDGDIAVAAMNGHSVFVITGAVTELRSPGIKNVFTIARWYAADLKTIASPPDRASLLNVAAAERITLCYRGATSLVIQVGALVDPLTFGNWAAPPWLKYSGRWGRQGSPIMGSVGNFDLQCMSPGPTGIQMKGNWFNSPPRT